MTHENIIESLKTISQPIANIDGGCEVCISNFLFEIQVALKVPKREMKPLWVTVAAEHRCGAQLLERYRDA